MQILRILNVQINSSSNIDIKFADKLINNLSVDNVSIVSETPNVPSSKVLQVKVIHDTLNITCQPLTPLASYFIELQSTASVPFISVHGTSKISEDGVSNKYLIVGPMAPNNAVRNFLVSYLKDNIYNIDDTNSIVSKYIDSLAMNFSKALYDIGQVKNENYLSFTVTDENKTRGEGPFDRLNEESAYQVLRVGRGRTQSNANTTFIFSDFPTSIITLQRQVTSDTLTVDSENNIGKFNINGLILNLPKLPVTKVNNIVFTLSTVSGIYTYNIETLGYQIKSSRYDKEFGFDYLLLENNQIKLNDSILQDPNFSVDKIIRVDVEYEYKDLGRVVDQNSITVFSVQSAIREVLPPIINVFNLAHAPIVDSNGDVITLSGVTFLNTDQPQIAHPAFKTEIPFRLNGLPFIPGQYSIDYSTGTVYVFGENTTNDGTGPTPPLASYKYKHSYAPEQDFVYDEDVLELVALPHGNLIESNASINFNYEEVLIPDEDYKISLHQEELKERVGNNLSALNVLKTKNSPITNVFRILNETSGEIYTIDRWNDNKIYFRYNTPPSISVLVGERAVFTDELNELIFVDSSLINSTSLKVFKILLKNSLLVSGTEDSIGSFTNSSVFFSRTDIFSQEKWFDRYNTETNNINILQNIGDYSVDYTNGIIYCVVSSTQNYDLGTISYKYNVISLQHPNVISVEDIYCQLSPLSPKNKTFTYTSVQQGLVTPTTLDFSEELFLNNSLDAPYQIYNNVIGVFDQSFVAGVSNQIKFVRGLFEYTDFINNSKPLNFAPTSISSGFIVNVNAISNQLYDQVNFDGTNFYVVIDQSSLYLSNNITYNVLVTRVADGLPLWDGSGIIVPGTPIKLVLSGLNSPAIGDIVSISYEFIINDLSRVVIDYNKGGYFIDYTYVADELIVSYEYGDNVLDFRQSSNVPAGTPYFVTYKAGALRDALLKNFGNLVNVPELVNFDIDFDRERYRDALTAALTSFIQGPTVSAIKNIGKTISHVEPEISESVFQEWSLGSSLLSPDQITVNGATLSPGKFGDGILITEPFQNVTFPFISNVRLEEGTFETWLIPQWNGIDNDAALSFNITKDGYEIDSSNIFVGAAEYHPTISNGNFILDKNSNVIGKPNKNKDGIFIYYDLDINNNFNRWFIEIIDGYVFDNDSKYKIKITSTGNFYDVQNVTLPKSSNVSIFTGTNSVSLTVSPIGTGVKEGVSFISDIEHYIFDVGEQKNKNRLSLLKDTSGYLVFKVYDRLGNPYMVSSDVSSWKHGEAHHVACSWKLNNYNNQDEIHLFVDGFEVPNIIRYGQKLAPFLHEKFRTVNPEEIVGLVDRDIISSVDLITTQGNTTVTSTINFSAYNIFTGDIIHIDESGFDSNGYVIVSVSGQTLTLDTIMPLSISEGRFTINRTDYIVDSEINLFSNITVSVMSPILSDNDIIGDIGANIITSSTHNFSTENIKAGYTIRIDHSSLETTYTILSVNNSALTLNGSLPVAISGENYRIYDNIEVEIPGIRALHPSYSISKNDNFNDVLTISNNVLAGDLILVRTLGLNHKKVKQNYYVWSNGAENVIMTGLPSPASLDEVKITKVILPVTIIGPANSVFGAGQFTSNNIVTNQPSNTERTLSIILSGSNVDFSTTTKVTINGVSNAVTINEIINFSEYGTQDSVNLFSSINYIKVESKPINSLKNACTVTIKEKYVITYSENSQETPIIRYSYSLFDGNSLYWISSDSVRDDNNLFSHRVIGNYLFISAPAPVAGYYVITGISDDLKTLTVAATVNSTLPLFTFTNGTYKILNTTSYRSGLQNGFFVLEKNNLPGEPYYLTSGTYEFEYQTYIKIKLDPIPSLCYIGNSFQNGNQINAVLDQIKIYSTILTDTRVGEDIPSSQKSITKDFNSLKKLRKDNLTIMLLDFDEMPVTNQADFYISSGGNKKHFHTIEVINDNFKNSLALLEKPLIISNDGILNTKSEATIEFWINPLFDTANDPNTRFYFDAYSAIIEETISINNTSVKIKGPASQILSVKLTHGDPKIDYFAGGKLEIDTQRALVEEHTSVNNATVIVDKPILQIISVKILGDLTSTDYFDEGAIGIDKKTIYLNKTLPYSNVPVLVTYQSTENNNETINTQVIRLNKKLPYFNSKVTVTYLPKGLQGNRISIFKDPLGDINFGITASGYDFIIKAPAYWYRNTWHRIKASYKINGMSSSSDEMRLFIDGYQYTDVIKGYNLISNESPSIEETIIQSDGYYIGSMKFIDSINNIFLGTQYNYQSPTFSLIDNLRISNIFRPIYAPYGESIDINYNSNLSVVFPVTSDLYTTYLLDFDLLTTLHQDFALLKNRNTGSFDFSINIFDSFGIVNSSIKIKEVLEKLIKILKPANSKVFIQYTI